MGGPGTSAAGNGEVQAAPPSILIVDDIAANLRLFAATLEAQGYRARAVPSGRLALRAATLAPPDLILLDIKMPEMDGYEVCRRLKEDARLRDIPVIFVSALGEEFDKVRAFECGAVDYLTKPCPLQELCARVETHLRLRSQQRRLDRQAAALRAANKELDRSNHELREFASVISHDLKAPLRAIRHLAGFVFEDSADQLSTESHENLRMLVERTRLAQRMIDELLDFCCAGVRPGEEVELDCNELVAEVIETIRPPEGFEVKLEGKLPSLSTYVSPLRHVFINLIDNAIKHQDASNGCVWVACREQGPDCLRFEVRDNGPGIEEQHRTRVFRMFQKLGKKEGSGVGLALAKRHVEAFGGQIGFESEPGSGTTFFFTWPRRAAPALDRVLLAQGGG